MNRFAPAVVAVSLITLFALFGSVAHAQEDVTPPNLLDVTFEPETIDTSKGPQTITVTVHVTDDLSGLAWISLSFSKPGTTQGISINFNPEMQIGEIIEGDLNDGWIVRTTTLPQYSAYGEWEMDSVSSSDNVGNRVSLYKPENGTEGRGTDSPEWPSLFNGFNFAVGAADVPQEPTQRLFMPMLGQ